jgi:hypothetical protein
MWSASSRKFVAIAMVAVAAQVTSAYAQAQQDKRLGRDFLYCGDLNLRLLKMQAKMLGEPEKYKEQEKAAYVKTMSIAGAHIPAEEMDKEVAEASAKLSAQIVQASRKEQDQPGHTGKFLQAQYENCVELEKAYGLEAFRRAVSGGASNSGTRTEK